MPECIEPCTYCKRMGAMLTATREQIRILSGLLRAQQALTTLDSDRWALYDELQAVCRKISRPEGEKRGE